MRRESRVSTVIIWPHVKRCFWLWSKKQYQISKQQILWDWCETRGNTRKNRPVSEDCFSPVHLRERCDWLLLHYNQSSDSKTGRGPLVINPPTVLLHTDIIKQVIHSCPRSVIAAVWTGIWLGLLSLGLLGLLCVALGETFACFCPGRWQYKSTFLFPRCFISAPLTCSGLLRRSQ